MTTKPNTVDEYITYFSKDLQNILEQIRLAIKKAAPEAKESISYAMPAYKLNGRPLVYFAGYAKHIGFYATPTGHTKFSKELSKYKQGKGSVQFPLDNVPFNLIEEIVKFRVAENQKHSAKKEKNNN